MQPEGRTAVDLDSRCAAAAAVRRRGIRHQRKRRIRALRSSPPRPAHDAPVFVVKAAAAVEQQRGSRRRGGWSVADEVGRVAGAAGHAARISPGGVRCGGRLERQPEVHWVEADVGADAHLVEVGAPVLLLERLGGVTRGYGGDPVGRRPRLESGHELRMKERVRLGGVAQQQQLGLVEEHRVCDGFAVACIQLQAEGFRAEVHHATGDPCPIHLPAKPPRLPVGRDGEPACQQWQWRLVGIAQPPPRG